MERKDYVTDMGVIRPYDLSSLSSRLEPSDAAKLCGRAASVAVSAMEREKDASAPSSLCSGLSSLAARLGPSDAAKLCGRAASLVVSAMEREKEEKDPNAMNSLSNRLSSLSYALSSLSSRLEPSDAAKLCRRAIRQQARGRAEDREDQGMPGAFVHSVATLLPFIDPPTAHALARELAPGMTDLETVFRDTSRPVQIERAARTALATIGQGFGGHPGASFLIAAEPYPCRLTAQELVDLLKMPTCFGDARRLVLDHLSNRYGRRFANHWEFVRFAHERGLNLDLKTPPRRPDPKESFKRIVELLDEPGAQP
jgi:hypothetical protein